jgi:hypothetical protein
VLTDPPHATAPGLDLMPSSVAVSRERRRANTELRRDMARLCAVREEIKEVQQERPRKLATNAPAEKDPHARVRIIARVLGIGIETADMLVNETVALFAG